jgi:hypothetical protein
VVTQSSIGGAYVDSSSDPRSLVVAQQSGQRFVDALDEFAEDLALLVATFSPAAPVGSGVVPDPTPTLKVTSWIGEDGITHWVETPKGDLNDNDWEDVHSARVAAAKAEYPEAS